MTSVHIHGFGPNGELSPGATAALTAWAGPGGGASALNDLTDVDTTGQTTGDVLKYNGTNWVADAASAGTVTSTDISDSTAVGRDVLTAADAAAARAAIGAGIEEAHTFTIAGTVYAVVGGHRLYIEEASVIESVRASVGDAPTGASLIVDVNRNGTTIYGTQANRPTITAGTNTDLGGAASNGTLAAGDYLTVDVDQIGTTAAGTDLTVTVRLRRN